MGEVLLEVEEDIYELKMRLVEFEVCEWVVLYELMLKDWEFEELKI